MQITEFAETIDKLADLHKQGYGSLLAEHGCTPARIDSTRQTLAWLRQQGLRLGVRDTDAVIAAVERETAHTQAETYRLLAPIAAALREAGLEADARDLASVQAGIEHCQRIERELGEAQAKLAEIDRQREGREREQLIERGERLGKITPHMANAARGKVDGKPWSLEQLRAVLLHGGRIVPEAVRPPPSAPMRTGGRDLSADAATYAAMSFAERAALAKEDPSTHDELRRAWLEAGAPIKEGT